MSEGTKVVYHVGAEDTPYLVCVPISPDEITLGDFTREISKTEGYRYYFKTVDDDIIVKQEIKDTTAKLPYYNGRVVAWVAPDPTYQAPQSAAPSGGNGAVANGTHKKYPGKHTGIDSDASSICSDASSIMTTDAESSMTGEESSVVGSDEEKRWGVSVGPRSQGGGVRSAGSRVVTADDSSVMGSDEDKREPRQKVRRRKRRKEVAKIPQRCSSYSSMTDSMCSLNIITVTLDLNTTCNYLGFSIYSSSDDASVPGIYVGSIYKGGAVEADGRISCNDLILHVNDISFEKIGNGEAARILQEEATKGGQIRLVVAKTTRDSIVDLHDEQDYTDADTMSLASNVLDPTEQWIQQQQRTGYGIHFPEGYPAGGTNYSLYSTTGSESPAGSQIGGDTIRGQYQPPRPPLQTRLSALHNNMDDVLQAMTAPGSGLEIKERTWLKVTIPNAFIGQDLVKWLKDKIEGLSDHKAARKYANTMLKNGFISNTVNKSEKFSDQCYYSAVERRQRMVGDAPLESIQQTMQGLSIDGGSQRSGFPSWAGGKPASVRSHGSGGTLSSSSPRSAPRGMVAAYPAPPPPPQYPHHQYASSTRSGFAPFQPDQKLTRVDSSLSLASTYSQSSVASFAGRPIGSMHSSVAGSQASFKVAMDNSIEYYSDAV